MKLVQICINYSRNICLDKFLSKTFDKIFKQNSHLFNIRITIQNVFYNRKNVFFKTLKILL